MKKNRTPGELELRLTNEVMVRVEGKERFDATKALKDDLQRFTDEARNRRNKFDETQKRHLSWLARFGLIPLTILTFFHVFFVLGVGIYQGEITDISRYSNKTVALSSEPIYFWVTVSFHSCITTFLVWIVFKCGRATKWFVRRPINSSS